MRFMKPCHLKLLYILMLALLLSSFTKVYSRSADDLQIIESTDRGLTVQITPSIDQIDTTKIKGESYLKFYLNNSSFSGDASKPTIQSRIINLGIPVDAQPTVHIVTAQSHEISGKLLPIPSYTKEGITYEMDPNYYQSALFLPEQLIESREIHFYRDQRTLRLKINLMQFNGNKSAIKIYNKIILKIEFNASNSINFSNQISQSENEFYKDLILNFDKSKKWLISHPKKLSKTEFIFPTENVFKIEIRDDGFYKITGTQLAELGVDLSSIHPNTFRLFNNGGEELSVSLITARPDSLIENSILVVDGGDNKFDNSDYIVFYGKSVNNWNALQDSSGFFQHYINHYTYNNVYFLSWDNSISGKRFANNTVAVNSNLPTAQYFNGLYFDEDELNNYLDSGLNWYGRLMVGSDEQSYGVRLPSPASESGNVYFKFSCLGLTSGSHRFDISLNDQFLTSFTFSSNTTKTNEIFRTIQLSDNGYNTLKVIYTGNSSESQAYVDWFEIQYKKNFIAEDNVLFFNSISSTTPQNFTISNFDNDQIEVYDITDPFNIQIIQNKSISSGTVTFSENSGQSRHYIALTTDSYKEVGSIEKINFANIRTTETGADFIIIAHDDFYDAIQPLKDHRENHDSLKTVVMKISDIYNEFSWGLFDPTAIRDFIKFAYYNWSPSPRYVLLCGDGDFDFKNIKNDLDKNWIPAYQTTELNENVNRTMDEWYVTVHGNDATQDLSIGRFPVQSAEEVQNVVEKIIDYEVTSYLDVNDTESINDWRNTVTMVGDDEYHTPNSDNETLHTRDAEYIIENYVPDYLNKEKIYLIEYAAEKDPSTSGFMKPAATEALLNQINKGTLILNYIGHGAPSVWADERVLKESRDFDRIQNIKKLPLWVAATCDFGRFDDPLERGLAEKLFVAKNLGGIAFITSARVAYAGDNTALNRAFYDNLFLSGKQSERLGVALMKAKIENSGTTNDQKYHLFGDPTMRLAIPHASAAINSINPDTLKALSNIEVAGNILKSNSIWNDFNGKALLKVFDSRENINYTTKYGSIISYKSPGKTIFRGIVNVTNGNFHANFIVPKDITYGGRFGRVSFYFMNDDVQGNAFKDTLQVGGTSVLHDEEGPIIKVGFEGQNFFDGNIVNEDSKMVIEIADSVSGVNIAGDIGHNITLTINDDETNKKIITDLFNYYENNFKAGKIIYDLSNYQKSSSDEVYGLSKGNHKIIIKAWDNFNNSSIKTTNFTVVSSSELKLSDVLNFPNPMIDATTFSFVCSQFCNVRIKIFTINGRLIQTIDNIVAESGMNHVFWDGLDRDNDALANGVYLYKIIAKTSQLEKTLSDEYIGKIVVTR